MEVEDRPSSKSVLLPVTWTLTDQKGRTLEALVLGRTPGAVKLRRLSDGQEFEIGIETLAAADQERVRQLPIEMIPSAPPVTTPKLSWAAQRVQDELDETVKEIATTQELFVGTSSKIQRRTLKSTLDRLVQKEAKLRSELTELTNAEQQGR